MERYLYTEFAERPVVIDGQSFDFEKIAFSAGHWIGTYKDVDGSKADMLLKLRSISELSDKDYENLQAQKKTTPFSNSSSSWNNSLRPVEQPTPKPLPTPSSILESKAGVVSAGSDAKTKEEEPASKYPERDAVLVVGPIASPNPIVDGERKLGEAKPRKTRKKS